MQCTRAEAIEGPMPKSTRAHVENAPKEHVYTNSFREGNPRQLLHRHHLLFQLPVLQKSGQILFCQLWTAPSCFLGFLKNVRALLGCSLPKMSQPQSMIAQLDADCARVSSSSSSCNSSVLVDLHNLQPPHGSSSQNTMKQLVILVSFFPHRQRPPNTITTE